MTVEPERGGEEGRRGAALETVHVARAAAVAAFARLVESRAADLEARLGLAIEASRLSGFLPERIAIPSREIASGGMPPIRVVENPRRADPNAAAPLPPLEARGFCPLCDFPYAQMVLPLELAAGSFRAAPSPARYTEADQWTIATRRHLPQRFEDDTAFAGLLAAMFETITEAPGMLAGFNGAGAGASVTGHRHFHLLACPDPGIFPVLRLPGEGILGGAVRLAGAREELIARITALAAGWRACCGSRATENLLLLREGKGFRALYVPRRADRETLSGLPEIKAGFLEAALRTLVLRRDGTIAAFREGRLAAETLEVALRSIVPPEFPAWAERAIGRGGEEAEGASPPAGD